VLNAILKMRQRCFGW